MSETIAFACSICGEPSTEICVYCTKDTCENHRCEKCQRCSDCCQCEQADIMMSARNGCFSAGSNRRLSLRRG